GGKARTPEVDWASVVPRFPSVTEASLTARPAETVLAQRRRPRARPGGRSHRCRSERPSPRAGRSPRGSPGAPHLRFPALLQDGKEGSTVRVRQRALKERKVAAQWAAGCGSESTSSSRAARPTRGG